jgi:hypothetical protein
MATCDGKAGVWWSDVRSLGWSFSAAIEWGACETAPSSACSNKLFTSHLALTTSEWRKEDMCTHARLENDCGEQGDGLTGTGNC